MPPIFDRGLRDDEYSDNEEDPINFNVARPYSEWPTDHLPNPPITLPTRIISNIMDQPVPQIAQIAYGGIKFQK